MSSAKPRRAMVIGLPDSARKLLELKFRESDVSIGSLVMGLTRSGYELDVKDGPAAGRLLAMGHELADRANLLIVVLPYVGALGEQMADAVQYLEGMLYGIGSESSFEMGALSANQIGEDVEDAFQTGIVGGMQSMAEGGHFGQGFLEDVTPLAASFATNGYAGFNGSERVLAGAVVGGTASVLGGGKFANGAITGAFFSASMRFAEDFERGASAAGAALDVFGGIWALPDTAVGLAVGTLDMAASLIAGHVPSFGFVNGTLQISNLVNLIAGGGITFGNVQLYTDVAPRDNDPGPSFYTGLGNFSYEAHEFGHTDQSYIYGPFWLPAYGIGAIAFGWYSNPFETYADYHAVYGTSPVPLP